MTAQKLCQCHQMKVVRMSNSAILPKRTSIAAAGYDLYSISDYTIPPFGKISIDTGLAIQVPHGHYGRIAPRSEMAKKYFIDVGAGVIDRDYVGNVFVLLFNFSHFSYKINKYDVIAQLIIEKISKPFVIECSALPQTVRGSKGFGSTDRDVIQID